MALRNGMIRTRRIADFTMIELLVVIAIIAILAALLLPSLNKAKQRGQSVGCVNTQKQLYYYIAMYASDNKDYLPYSNSSYKPDGSAYGYDGRTTWYGPVSEYAKTKIGSYSPVWVCPSAKGKPDPYTPASPVWITYGWNYFGCDPNPPTNTQPGPTRLGAGNQNGNKSAYIRQTPLVLFGDSELMYFGGNGATSTTVQRQQRTAIYKTGWDNGSGVFSNSRIHAGGLNMAFIDGQVRWFDGRRSIDNMHLVRWY